VRELETLETKHVTRLGRRRVERPGTLHRTRLYTITDSPLSAKERFNLYPDSDKEVGYKAIKSDVIRQMWLRDK